MNNIYSFDENQPGFTNNFGQYSPTHTNSFPMSSSPSSGYPNEYPNQGMMPSVMIPPLTQPPTTMRTTTVRVPSNADLDDICGTRHSETEITPLVFGGEETQRGDWYKTSF